MLYSLTLLYFNIHRVYVQCARQRPILSTAILQTGRLGVLVLQFTVVVVLLEPQLRVERV